jgi:hypothetical protein
MSADRVAVDANILVYAVYRDTPQHAASRAWLERAARGDLLGMTGQTGFSAAHEASPFQPRPNMVRNHG